MGILLGGLPNRYKMMTDILMNGSIQQTHCLTVQCATAVFVRTWLREAEGVGDENGALPVITLVFGLKVTREPEQARPKSGCGQRHWRWAQ